MMAIQWTKHLPVILLVVLFMTVEAKAQSTTPRGGWIDDAKSGCRIWDPDPQPNESVTWSGTCQDGHAQGTGIMAWSNGDRYNGEVRNGKLEGHGVFAAANGDRCDCNWHDGAMNGRGVYTFANGSTYKRYDGELDAGKMNGKGILTFANGDRYEGQFRDNQIAGHGILFFANGDRYDGDWRDNKANGNGTLTRSGRDHSGTWVNGCLKGFISLAWVGADKGSCR